MNLTKVIKQIKLEIEFLEIQRDKEIQTINKTYDKIIQDLKTALRINMNINTICLKCEGSGDIIFTSASNNTERKKCNACGGTGEQYISENIRSY